jgi:hypothetical protein
MKAAVVGLALGSALTGRRRAHRRFRKQPMNARGLTAALMAAAALCTPAAQAQEDSERGWFAGERGLSAKLVAGPALHRLHELWVISGDVELGIGAQTGSGGWYGTLGGRFGSTDGGLAFRQLGIGASWEAPVEPRWHVGLGFDISYAGFDRASTDGTIGDLGLGGRAFTTYDVVHGDSAAVFLGLELGADAYVSAGTTPLYGGGLRLGARLF